MNDAEATIAELEEASVDCTTRTFRLRWLTCVVLLRAVGHVVDKVDGNRLSFIRQAAGAALVRWKADRPGHLLFWELIETQRNDALKEYRFAYAEEGGPPLPLLIGQQVLQPVEAARMACAWWDAELTRIEQEAYILRKVERRRANGARF